MSTLPLNPHGLGYFWRWSGVGGPDLDDEQVARGHIELSGGWAEVEVLDEDPMGGFVTKPDELSTFAIVASLRDNTMLLPEAHRSGFQRNIGGGRASVELHRSRTVVGGVPINRLRSERLTKAEVHFLGLRVFSGLSAVTERRTADERGLSKTYAIEVGETDPIEVSLTGGRVLSIGTTWATSGSADAREVRSPVTLSCQSTRPLPASRLLQPLVHVQDLFSFAHSGVVLPVGGSAMVDLEPHPRDELETRPTLWDGSLMAINPGVPEAPENAQGLVVRLATLGGARALGRWSRLYDRHRRAIRPVVGRYRVGLPTAELQLMEVAAGIEYWVNVHKGRKWSQRRKGEGHVHSLVRHVGSAFGELVENPDGWADLFRDANNGLKHNPSYAEDEDVLAALGGLGRYLLGVALLNRVGGSKRPGQEVLRSYRVQRLVEPLRDRLASA